MGCQVQAVQYRPRGRFYQGVETVQVPDALLKIQTVVAVTGLSESTIRRRVASGAFPAPVRDGKHCTRWVAGKVQDWLRERGAQ